MKQIPGKHFKSNYENGRIKCSLLAIYKNLFSKMARDFRNFCKSGHLKITRYAAFH